MSHSEQQAHHEIEFTSPIRTVCSTGNGDEPVSAGERLAEASDTRPTDLDSRFAVEARFYEKLAGGRVRCLLCPRACNVGEGGRGYCRVRENRGGRFFSLVYSRACSAHPDPVEKKPLFHYLPGTLAFSVATAGCNVHCKYCQNWEISRASPEQIRADYLTPQRVVELALWNGCPTIAFTYTEPTVFAEYVMDTREAAHQAGLRVIAVSNGYITPPAARAIYANVDAVKVDLKAFSEGFYRSVVRAQLRPVLETLVTIRSLNKWLEVVYLVVPGLNDSDEELRGAAAWVRTNLGADVPLHFTRFHPDYLLKNLPPTPVTTLERARGMGIAEGLRYVYLGNVPGHAGEDTFCPNCARGVIQRAGMRLIRNLLRDGACPFCQQTLPGVWPT